MEPAYKAFEVSTVEIRGMLALKKAQLVGVGMTMLASSMYHLAGTPTDAAFQPQVWAPPA